MLDYNTLNATVEKEIINGELERKILDEIPQGTSLLSDIVDSKGNHRFIEGEGTWLLENSYISTPYCRWSLSGTHLMLVLALSTTSQEQILNGTSLAEFELPNFVLEKIVPLYDNGLIYRNTHVLMDSTGSTQTISTGIYKENNKIVIKLMSSLTTSTKKGRVQYDLLIDSTYNE